MNLAKNIGKNFIGSLISNLILVVTIPFIAKIYNISVIGEFAYFYGFVSVFSVLATLRLDLALMNTFGNRVRVKLFNLIFTVVLSFTLISIIVISFLILSKVFTSNIKLLLFLPFLIFSSSIYRVIIMNLVFNAKFGFLMWILIINSGVLVLSQILLGLYYPDVHMLAASYLIAFLAVFFTFLKFFTFRKVIGILKLTYIIQSVYLLKDNIRYIKYNLPGDLINSITIQVPYLLGNIFFNSSQIGAYYLADKILRSPVGLISDVLGKNFMSSYNVFKMSKKLTTMFTLNFYFILLDTSLFFALFLKVLIPVVLPVFFDSSWQPAVSIILELIPMYSAIFLSVPIIAVLAQIGKNHVDFLFQILLFLTFVFSFWLGNFRDSFHTSIFTLSCLTLSLYTLTGFLVLKYMEVNLFSFMQKIKRNGVIYFLYMVTFLVSALRDFNKIELVYYCIVIFVFSLFWLRSLLFFIRENRLFEKELV